MAEKRLGARRFAASLIAATVLLALFARTNDNPAGLAPGPTSASGRALAAYQAQQAFLSRPALLAYGGTPQYLDQALDGHWALIPYLAQLFDDAPAWPYSQAIAATQAMLELSSPDPGEQAALGAELSSGLARYWDGTAYSPSPQPWQRMGISRFYDDNAWIALDLVSAYRMTADRQALARAEDLYRFISTGWDANPADASPGGVFWTQSADDRDRNTCSNAPAAELALRLYQLTGDKTYLQQATRTYDWVRATLLDRDGLYWDHISPQGRIYKTKWSYNQGTMIGAGVLLYTITGDGTYLRQAQATAEAALRYYNTAAYLRQSAAFNAILFRNLLLLSTVDATHLAAARQAMQDYANQAWLHNRSSANLFAFPGAARTTRLLDQAGMVEIYACLSCDPARYTLLV